MSFHDEWFSYPNNSNLFDFYSFIHSRNSPLSIDDFKRFRLHFAFNIFSFFHEIKKKNVKVIWIDPDVERATILQMTTLICCCCRNHFEGLFYFKKEKKKIQLSSLDSRFYRQGKRAEKEFLNLQKRKTFFFFVCSLRSCWMDGGGLPFYPHLVGDKRGSDHWNFKNLNIFL